jgi:hypothetical protein
VSPEDLPLEKLKEKEKETVNEIPKKIFNTVSGKNSVPFQKVAPPYTQERKENGLGVNE